MECERCKTELKTFSRDQGGFVRNICRCEKDQRCTAKGCKNAASQVWLDEGGEVESWRCDGHGDEGHAGEIPSRPAVAIRVQEAPPQAQPSAEPDDVVWARLEELFRAESAHDTTRIRCGSCGREHRYKQRKWTRRKWPSGVRSLLTCCPGCGAEGYALVD